LFLFVFHIVDAQWLHTQSTKNVFEYASW